MICRTASVGARFRPGALERSKGLRVGEELVLMREPSNPFDRNAVAVSTQDGMVIGHVPRTEAPLIARVLDAGKPVTVTVEAPGSNPDILIHWEG